MVVHFESHKMKARVLKIIMIYTFWHASGCVMKSDDFDRWNEFVIRTFMQKIKLSNCKKQVYHKIDK